MQQNHASDNVNPLPPGDRVLRRKHVRIKFGIGDTTLHKYMNEDSDFPKPIRFLGNSCGWLESELDAYIAKRVAERDINGPSE